MKGKQGVQKAHAFLELTDFHVLLSALDAYLHFALQQNQGDVQYQDLYTKVDIAVATMDAGNPKTLDLNHEELCLLLTALMKVNEAVAVQGSREKGSLKQYTLLMGENVARVQGLLWAELLRAYGGQNVQLLD